MRHLTLLSGLLLCGCLQSVAEEAGDAGSDSGHDAGGDDAGLPDAGPADAGLADGGRDDAGLPEVDGGVLFGTVRPDCAPRDGPAYRFQLSDQPLSCDTAQSEGFYVSLWISPLVPGSYKLGPDFSQQGDACLCGVVTDSAQLGSLMEVDTATDAGVTGRIDATFSGGFQVHTRWQVIWCPGAPFCG